MRHPGVLCRRRGAVDQANNRLGLESAERYLSLISAGRLVINAFHLGAETSIYSPRLWENRTRH
jgi:hypothetical protein